MQRDPAVEVPVSVYGVRVGRRLLVTPSHHRSVNLGDLALAKTVIVIGAGASVDFGFPTGPELNGLIALAVSTKLDEWRNIRWTDPAVDEALRSWEGISPNEFYEASQAINEGIHFHPSPDDYLFAMGADKAIVAAGKVGIATAVLQKERSSWLAKLNDTDDPQVGAKLVEKKAAWPLQLLGYLSPGLRAAEVDRLFSDIAFVNFNYDRCLEHALYHGVKRSHRLSSEDAASVIRNVKIVHPYGKIADLPWEARRDVVPFGGAYRGLLPEIAGRIQTLTEAHHTDEELSEIAQLMAEARRIVFLGFGFLKQNMALLSVPNDPNRAWQPRVSGTVFRTSNSQENVFRERVLGAFNTKRPTFANLTCDSFLQENGLEVFSR